MFPFEITLPQNVGFEIQTHNHNGPFALFSENLIEIFMFLVPKKTKITELKYHVHLLTFNCKFHPFKVFKNVIKMYKIEGWSTVKVITE